MIQIIYMILWRGSPASAIGTYSNGGKKIFLIQFYNEKLEKKQKNSIYKSEALLIRNFVTKIMYTQQYVLKNVKKYFNFN